MAYHPLNLDSRCPAIVRNFLVNRIEDHYFADVHTMLRLPVPRAGLTAGCNFTLMLVLASVVSGVSVTLYDAKAGKEARNRGRLFKSLLEDFYPWELEPLPDRGEALVGEKAAEIIYGTFRNPLTHSLGKHDERKTVKVNRVNGTGLTEQSVEKIECGEASLSSIPTVWRRPDATLVLVERLYFGTRRMIETLTACTSRMRVAAHVLETDTAG